MIAAGLGSVVSRTRHVRVTAGLDSRRVQQAVLRLHTCRAVVDGLESAWDALVMLAMADGCTVEVD